jgi:hypothetical protein
VEIMRIMRMNGKIFRILLAFCLCYASCVMGGEVDGLSRPSWESQRYLMEGVHYLVNEEDLAKAKEFLQKAILSSSFDSLSSKTLEQKYNKTVVAEAYYFLGKIYYEQALLEIKGLPTTIQESKQYPSSVVDSIAWAKRYLRRSDEYGLVHDRMHPPMLAMLDKTFPDIEPSPWTSRGGRTKVTVEAFDNEPYYLDVVKIDENADVTESKFLTDEEFNLERGARYKIKPDTRGVYDTMYKVLAILGLGIVIWRARY